MWSQLHPTEVLELPAGVEASEEASRQESELATLKAEATDLAERRAQPGVGPDAEMRRAEFLLVELRDELLKEWLKAKALQEVQGAAGGAGAATLATKVKQGEERATESGGK